MKNFVQSVKVGPNLGNLWLNYNKVKFNLKFTKYKITLNSIHDKRSIYNKIYLRIIKSEINSDDNIK